MKQDSAHARTIAFAFLTSALSLVLYALEYPQGAAGVAGSITASAAASLAVVYAAAKIREYRENHEFEGQLSDSLSSAVFYNFSGLPLRKSIMLSTAQGSMAAGPLSRLANSLGLGQPFSEAFPSALSSSGLRAFATAEHGQPVTVSRIGSLVSMREHALKSRLAGMESSAQRYSTAGMFIAVILPSFVLFSFMGSAVMSGGAYVSALMYPVLVCVLPAVYAFSTMLVSRSLNG